MPEREPRFNSFSPEGQDNKTDYRVEVATPADLQQLNATFLPPEDDPEQHQHSLALLEKDEGNYFIMKHSDDIAGHATLEYNWQSPHYPDIKGPVIMGVEVAEAHRRKGLVKKLLQACEQDIKSRGGREVFVDVAEDNQVAINAYKKYGYEEIPNTRYTLPKNIDPEQIPGFHMKKALE